MGMSGVSCFRARLSGYTMGKRLFFALLLATVAITAIAVYILDHKAVEQFEAAETARIRLAADQLRSSIDRLTLDLFMTIENVAVLYARSSEFDEEAFLDFCRGIQPELPEGAVIALLTPDLRVIASYPAATELPPPVLEHCEDALPALSRTAGPAMLPLLRIGPEESMLVTVTRRGAESPLVVVCVDPARFFDRTMLPVTTTFYDVRIIDAEGTAVIGTREPSVPAAARPIKLGRSDWQLELAHLGTASTPLVRTRLVLWASGISICLGLIFIFHLVASKNHALQRINARLVNTLESERILRLHLAEANTELRRIAITDTLTQLANRRYFYSRLHEEFERAKRHTLVLALLMVDIDFFKPVNDTYGHQFGDLVLVRIAEIIRSTCRSIDLPARYGGEEFCILMPTSNLSDALILAERMRKHIEASAFTFQGSTSYLTVSTGIGVFPGPHVHTVDELIRVADTALYDAKQSGRNRVSVHIS